MDENRPAISAIVILTSVYKSLSLVPMVNYQNPKLEASTSANTLTPTEATLVFPTSSHSESITSSITLL